MRSVAVIAGTAVTAGLVMAELSGCSGTPHGEAVSVSVAFVNDLERGDAEAACRLLTAGAEKSAAGATSTPCAKAITSIKERGRSIGRVQVWGDAAQVKVAGDTLFLRRISGSWRISAAGCKWQPKRPYDCMVGG